MTITNSLFPSHNDMAEGRYFMIRSKQAPDFVLDLLHGTTDPCTPVVTAHVTGADTQMWYADVMAGTLRNKTNNLCLDLDCECSLILTELSHVTLIIGRCLS